MSQFFSETLGAGPRQQNAFFDWARMAEQAQAQAQPEWSVPEAYFAILFTAATCDGALAPEEQEMLLALTHRSRTLKALAPEQLAAINTSVIERLRTDGDEALAKACAALPADMRLSVFAQALDIVASDNALPAEEAAFLNKLVANLGLERASVERVAGVMLLKNKY